MNLFKPILLVAVLFALPALAGQEGNGGFAVVCPNKPIQLLDYYELSQEGLAPDLGGTGLTVEQRVQYAISKLVSVDPLRQAIFTQYLNSFWGEAEILDIKGLSFTSKEIADPKLQKALGVGVVNIPSECTLEQLAQQPQINGPRYVIYKKMWEKADDITKAGLILHEIIYRNLLYVESYKKGDPSGSFYVRKLNNLISSSSPQALTRMEYDKNLLVAGLPVLFPDFVGVATSQIDESGYYYFDSGTSYVSTEYKSYRPLILKSSTVNICTSIFVASASRSSNARQTYFSATTGLPFIAKLETNKQTMDLSCELGAGQTLKVSTPDFIYKITTDHSFIIQTNSKPMYVTEITHPNIIADGLIAVDVGQTIYTDQPFDLDPDEDSENYYKYSKVQISPNNLPYISESIVLIAQHFSNLQANFNGRLQEFSQIFLERKTGKVMGGMFKNASIVNIGGSQVKQYGTSVNSIGAEVLSLDFKELQTAFYEANNKLALYQIGFFADVIDIQKAKDKNTFCIPVKVDSYSENKIMKEYISKTSYSERGTWAFAEVNSKGKAVKLLGRICK